MVKKKTMEETEKHTKFMQHSVLTVQWKKSIQLYHKPIKKEYNTASFERSYFKRNTDFARCSENKK